MGRVLLKWSSNFLKVIMSLVMDWRETKRSTAARPAVQTQVFPSHLLQHGNKCNMWCESFYNYLNTLFSLKEELLVAVWTKRLNRREWEEKLKMSYKVLQNCLLVCPTFDMRAHSMPLLPCSALTWVEKISRGNCFTVGMHFLTCSIHILLPTSSTSLHKFIWQVLKPFPSRPPLSHFLTASVLSHLYFVCMKKPNLCLPFTITFAHVTTVSLMAKVYKVHSAS